MADYMAGKFPVWICAQRGVICSYRQWNEMSISSYSDAGAGGGYAAPLRIFSSAKNYQSFWIVSPDGKETEINPPPSSFRCREGQEALLLWGGKKGSSDGRFLLIYNFTTKKYSLWGGLASLTEKPFFTIIKGIFTYLFYAFLFFLIGFLGCIVLGRLSGKEDFFSSAAVVVLLLSIVFFAYGWIKTFFTVNRNMILSRKVVEYALRKELNMQR